MIRILVACTGLASTLPGFGAEPTTAEAVPTDEAPAVPFDPASYYPVFYAAVIDAMVEKEFENDSLWNEVHRTAVVSLIHDSKSPSAFAGEMAAVYAQLLDTVRASGHFAGREVERAIAGSDAVAMPIAMMIASGGIEVYRRKVLHPDFTAPFFEHATSHDEETVIAWIEREAAPGELADISWNGFELQDGDVVYHFSSPPVTWNIRTGRSGYAVVRAHRLVHHVITAQN